MEPSWYPGETLVSLNLEMGDGGQRSQESTVMASGRLMGWQVVLGKWHSVLTGTSVRTRKSAHVGSYQVWDPSGPSSSAAGDCCGSGPVTV